MYDSIETQIRSLQSLGVATGSYSNLLCPVILQKLPEELNLDYNRQRKTDELFDINDLVEFLRKEEECREASLIVRNLWSLETIGINPDNEVPNTVYTNKRYETRLLWKEDSWELKSNYEIAKHRLLGLSKTFEKNEELYLKYDGIIKEHLRDGIIERVNMSLDKNINTGYFLPHHAVVREQKDSTKVRIVFDASSKGKGALSLNDCLESGPNLNPDLLKIILRFRLHKIAFCADIQRAFLEIEIVEEDRQF
ncbi:integrase catalytic domain-containing protein [Trichonephila clavipes]|nr:integrase catalytic domain-containing protein [Trichonephila clavipes]